MCKHKCSNYCLKGKCKKCGRYCRTKEDERKDNAILSIMLDLSKINNWIRENYPGVDPWKLTKSQFLEYYDQFVAHEERKVKWW